MTNFLTTLSLLLWIGSNFAQEHNVIGDKCFTNENIQGNCRLIEACPSVYNDRDKHRRRPVFCGFHGTQPIICCSDSIPVVQNVPNTTRAPTNTTLRPIPVRTDVRQTDRCEHFGQYVYENITIARELNFVRENRCSLKKSDAFVGKKFVETKEFPHMVLIGTENNKEVRYFCAGALISESYVLTSAHCIKDTNAKYVKTASSSQGQYFTITQHIPHPQYTNTSFYHDIGLLKLNRPVIFSPQTRPACMPFTNVNLTEPLSSFIHSTWEITGDTGIQFVKVRLTKMQKNTCDEYYNNLETLTEGISTFTHICTIDSEKTTTTNSCKFNLGGPLTIFHPSTYCSYLVLGVSSFARTCGFTQSPIVFTDVRPYMPWIEQTVFSS